MRRLASAAIAFLAGAVGCGRSGPPAAPLAMATRDSAGIHIVEDRSALWTAGQAWSVDSLLLDLGAPDGEFQGFAAPVAMTRLSDGRIVVADAGAARLDFFSRDGHFLYHVGSAGRAPGQFQSLWGVFAGRADTVVAYDVAASRVTTFDPNGALVDTLTLAVPAGSNGYLPLGRSPTGELTLLRSETRVPFPGRPWSVAIDTGVVVRFSRAGTPLDSIGALAVGELVGLPVPQAGGGTVTLPIDRPLGRKAGFVVRGDTVWVGTGAEPALVQYVGGQPIRIVRIPGALTVVPASLVAEFKRRRRAMTGRLGVIDSVFNASLDSIPFSDYLPAYGQILGDTVGDIWVQSAGLPDLAPGDAALTWSVLAPDGRWLGQVALPPRVTLREIGPDYLLGSWIPDSGGAVHVRLFRLRKPAGGP
ncbi:MAG TPA: hypothetical protein VGR60_04810 [Gemmatimonadales bacterium]|nr:hypothetical protein [Gemmatimonadales bacterium]